MAVRPIVYYGDPVLREKAEKITDIDRDVKDLVSDMIATLKDAGGLGLAAPQVGASKRIFIIDLTSIDLTESVKVFINPKIIYASENEVIMEEGCLSFPGIYQRIQRPEIVRVKATDLEGKEFILEASGMLARAIQHENDHLNGVLYIDHFSSLSKALVKGKLNKLRKMAAAS
ncbi:MAG: peptide deformylase [Candidatus Zixiibacteriota bacterium]